MNPNVCRENQTYSGWTAGFGAEYALGTGGWTFKSETLYARLSSRPNFAFNDPVALGEFYTHPRQIWISRIGINYRFNVGQTVVARY